MAPYCHGSSSSVVKRLRYSVLDVPCVTSACALVFIVSHVLNPFRMAGRLKAKEGN